MERKWHTYIYMYIYNHICVHTHNMSLYRENYDERLKCMRLMFSDKKLVSDRKMTIESCYLALLRVAVLFSVQKLQSNEHKL